MENRTWDSLLVSEHEMIERAMDVLKRELERLTTNTQDPFPMRRAIDFLSEFGGRIHNKKEEDTLFPLMVKRGIPEDGPIRVMLMEHESERGLLQEMIGQLPELVSASEDDRADLRQRGLEYLQIRAEHIWKENDVLYNLGRKAFSEEDAGFLLREFEQLNVSTYGDNADRKFAQMLDEVEKGSKERKSLIHNLSYEQIDAIMETMPVEITFVDADDTVAYFNRLDKEKIFVRTRSVIGRKVAKCHPEQSVDTVNRIVQGFKDGSRDKAEFWIDFMGDKVLIRYFPVHDADRNYMGVLEVTQTIGDIQKITGQKRLLD